MAILSLPIIEDDVNVRVDVMPSETKGGGEKERWALKSVDAVRRNVMAAC